MLFNSFEFIVFLLLVIPAYFLLPTLFKKYFLLLSSYFFYAFWNVELTLLLIGYTLSTYLFVKAFSDNPNPKSRKRLFIICIVTNILFLLIFKYLIFFSDSLNSISFYIFKTEPFPELKILLPIGISFHILQSMGYALDVYKGKYQAETNMITYALFISFFPQLLAGPIERAKNLIPQLHSLKNFEAERFFLSLKRILWGFFKKLVIADNLAIIVDQVYGNPNEFNGVTLLFATYLFSFQIYCDFSGYVDIALGVAQMLGIKLSENFNFPYASKSIKEFWHRWHITLSTWFRDYIYIPLGGNQVSKAKWVVIILIVFLLSGLWHGANWAFLIWGSIHGFYLITENFIYHFLNKKIPAIKNLANYSLIRLLRVIFVFNAVTFAWIFFRADSLNTSIQIASKIFTSLTEIQNIQIYIPQFAGVNVLIVCSLIIFLLIVDNKNVITTYYNKLLNRFSVPDLVLTDLLIVGLLLLSQSVSKNFIYFQF